MPRLTTSDTQSASKPQASNGKTILIAEDDPFIARMYEVKLQRAGYTVVLKNNGRDAYEQAKAHKPDMMLLDLTMPELSGFEVVSALQTEAFNFEDCPVIILTNSSQQRDIDAAKKLGFDYYIKAELTPQEVVNKINQKLGIGGGTGGEGHT